ncbi:MAG: hypothetical protein KAR06_00750 [Deltaproteobacteria bacterium]|nr:hypothetical protein [Deltaproteobacteria bacterium]
MPLPYKKKTKPEPAGKKETGTFSRLAARAKSIDDLSREVGVKPPPGGAPRIVATGKAPVKGDADVVQKAASRVEREKAVKASMVKSIKDKRAGKTGGTDLGDILKEVTETVKKHVGGFRFGKGGVKDNPKKGHSVQTGTRG